MENKLRSEDLRHRRPYGSPGPQGSSGQEAQVPVIFPGPPFADGRVSMDAFVRHVRVIVADSAARALGSMEKS